ncbi:MAG: cell division protein ZapA [Betaproteobacteria bacterium]|nr:cell division protein ZapA [Betaproteobacteria bacterium]
MKRDASAGSSLDINLRGREYRVACAPEEREALQAAVRYVDAQMAEISARTNAQGERLAVMAALNMAHELLADRDASSFDARDFRRRISAMEARLDEALAQQERLF